jgi:proteasome accessory factor B
MERMFERDKDELRNMGIEIEVGQIDPLFEDEVGYLIKSSDIQIQPTDFSKEELMLMTMAANTWKESVFSDVSNNALMKLASIDSQITLNKVAISTFNEDGITLLQFEKIIEAIKDRKFLSFLYNDKDRLIAPYALKFLNGFWYLIGQDQGLQIKVFKIIRIQSEIKSISNKPSFDIPSDFNVDEFLKKENKEKKKVATLLIRENRVMALRNKGKVSPAPNGWEKLEIPFDDLNQLTTEILWYADDVVVESPRELRDQVIQSLQELING